MNRRNQADWLAVIEAHERSGQTAAAFCRAEGIDAKYFSARRRALVGMVTQPTSNFSSVQLPLRQTDDDVRVELAGEVVLRLSSGVEPAWLAAVLRALRD
jgi:hypothetical protein